VIIVSKIALWNLAFKIAKKIFFFSIIKLLCYKLAALIKRSTQI